MVKQPQAKEIGNERQGAKELVEKKTGVEALEEVSETVKERISKGLSIGAVLAVFKAALPPGETYNPFFEEENLKKLSPEKLETLWDKITATPWVQNHIESLVAEINRRMDSEPRKSIPDLSADLEINSNLKPGFIVAFDLNGYSQFLSQATNNQKRILDDKLQKTMFDLCVKYGITLLQAPAGDCYIFHFPYENAASKKRFDAFLKEMSELNIPTGLANPDSKKFPNGNFRASIGWSFSSTGDTNAKLYTGPGGSDQGITHVYGKAFVNALNAQDKAADGEIKTDIPEDFDYEEHSAKVVHLNREKKYKIPKDKKLAVATLSALITATHPKGSFSQYTKRKGADTTLPELGVSSIAVNIGESKSRKDLAESPEKYDAILKGLLKLQEKYPEIRVFKIDVNVLHLTSSAELQKGGAQRILQFAKELAQLIEKSELKYGIGVEYNSSLVRINVKDSTIEERSGNGISVATKMAKENIEQPIRVGRDFAEAAWGNIHELTLHEGQAKGVTLQILPLELDDVDKLHKIHGKELVGAEKDLEQITHFVERIGKNGSALEIRSDVPGAGASARIRFAMREADRLGLKRINVEREGDGPYALIHGFLKSIYPDFKASDEAEIFLKAEEALLDNSWKSKAILICDIKNLSALEADYLAKVMSSIVGYECGFVYSADIPTTGKHEVIKVGTLSPEVAAELLFKTRPDLQKEKPVLFDQVKNELERIAEGGGPALIPSNIVHIYSKALKAEAAGTTANFELGKMDTINTGEFAKKIESESHDRQFLLGLIAYIKVPVSQENLWELCKRLKPELARKVFDEDMEYFLDNSFIEKTADSFILKNSDFYAPACELISTNFDVQKVSGEILKLEFAEDISSDEAKFNHQITSAAELGVIRETCLKITRFYIKNGSLNAAREASLKYLNHISYDIEDVDSESIDFYLELAWAFVQGSGNGGQMIAVSYIYNKVLEISDNEAQRNKALWGLFRIIGSASLALVTEDAKKAKKEPERKDEILSKNTSLIKLEEFAGLCSDPEMAYCIEAMSLYQTIVFWDIYSTRKIDPLKKADLLAETEKLFGKKPEFDGKAEQFATAMRLIGGCYNVLAEREKAREFFAIASKAYENLDIPDHIQSNDCGYGDIYAEEFIIFLKELPAIKSDEDREKVLNHLDDLMAKIETYVNKTIILGDQTNRIKALKILAEIREIKLLTIAKKPQESDNESQVQRLHDEYREVIGRSFKLRKLILPQDVLPEENWLDELHDSMSNLPEHLWSKDECKYCKKAA